MDIRGVLNGTPSNHFSHVFFDGNDNMAIPPINLRGQSFSVEFWIKRAANGAATLLSQGNAFSLGFDANNLIVVNIGEESLSSTMRITDQKWHHVAMVLDAQAGQMNLYLDGTSDASQAFTQTINIPANRILVGESFRGAMHDLRIWGRTRSSVDIASNYLFDLSGREAALLGNWPMNDGIGAFAIDITGRRDAEMNATWAFEAEARALEFDGASDYFTIDAPDLAFNAESDFSVSFWFKGDNGTSQTLFSTGRVENDVDLQVDAWAVQSDANGNLFVKNNGTFLQVGGGPYFDGQWHQFALTVNRFGNTHVYMDGERVASTNSENFDAFGGSPLYFAAYGRTIGAQDFIDQHFDGEIDEIRIWNLARRKEQIQRDKHFKMRGDEFGLVAYYPFESYTESGGVYSLTPSNEDFSDRASLGLNPLVSTLHGAPLSTNSTPVIKIPRQVEKVNFSYEINDDEIILTLIEDPKRIENTTLDITLKANGSTLGLADLYGNKMESSVSWIAFVDKNQLTWEEAFYDVNLRLDETHTFEATIQNLGGEAQDYTIGNLPTWLEAVPSSGRLDPLSSQTIRFQINEGLNIGRYEESIALTSPDFGFDELFGLNVNILAEAPDWTINPADYEFSMAFVGIIQLKGILSTDVNDRVAAFVNGELRGVAQLKYLPLSDNYRVYLDVYSNAKSPETEHIFFRIWDASEGAIVHSDVDSLGKILASVQFKSEGLLGTQDNPMIFKGSDKRLNLLALEQGWNWISINVLPADPNINTVFSGHTATVDDFIKNRIQGHSQFTASSSGPQWNGAIQNIENTLSYKMKVAHAAEIPITGSAIELSRTPVPIKENWNNLAYLGTKRSPVNQALSSYTASEGDLVKGQRSFAIYDPSEGWVGSLEFLTPNQGYDLKASAAGMIIYPQSASTFRYGKDEVEELPGPVVAYRHYEGTMSIIGQIAKANLDQKENYLLISYDKAGTVRGKTAMKNGKYYLTVYGDISQELLSFELWNMENRDRIQLHQQLTFVHDDLVGYPNPLEFKLLSTDIGTSWEVQEIGTYPNPFSDALAIRYPSARSAQLRIVMLDMYGKEVAKLFEGRVQEGWNDIPAKISSHLPSGVYSLVFEQNGLRQMKRIVKQ